jgi:UDP-N-acetylglucosamine:LPS N-acetylglucosamine transferase
VLNQAVGRIVDSGAVGAVVHLTGSEAYAEYDEISRASAGPWVTRAFEPAMEYFYAACDLVVCRAGAMTVSELAATATPAILVPLERVGQQWNARALSEAGGALIVEEGDVGSLPARVEAVLANEPGLAAMGHAAGTVGRPNAAAVIAERLIEAVDV